MLRSLQACRAFAAILVVVFHTSNGIFDLPKYFGHKPFGPVFDFGFAGVDFFFVLSGFIMMHVHASDFGQPRALGAYLWKRFTRIYPVYWVVFATMLSVYLLVPSFGYAYQRDPDVILRSFVLFPHSETHLVVGVAWTLVYEVFFYVLFGVLILNKRLGVLLLLVWTAGILAYPHFVTYPWNFVFSSMHLRFLAGIGVGMILQRWQFPLPGVTACLGMMVFLGTGLADAYAGPLAHVSRIVGYTLGSALMLAGFVQAERSGWIGTPNWLVYLGNASYAIYLVHFPALSALAKVAKTLHLDAFLPGPVLFLLHVLGAIAISCAFHQLVEQPLHAWTRRHFRREKAPVAAAAPPAVDLRKAA